MAHPNFNKCCPNAGLTSSSMRIRSPMTTFPVTRDQPQALQAHATTSTRHREDSLQYSHAVTIRNARDGEKLRQTQGKDHCGRRHQQATSTARQNEERVTSTRSTAFTQLGNSGKLGMHEPNPQQRRVPRHRTQRPSPATRNPSIGIPVLSVALSSTGPARPKLTLSHHRQTRLLPDVHRTIRPRVHTSPPVRIDTQASRFTGPSNRARRSEQHNSSPSKTSALPLRPVMTVKKLPYPACIVPADPSRRLRFREAPLLQPQTPMPAGYHPACAAASIDTTSSPAPATEPTSGQMADTVTGNATTQHHDSQQASLAPASDGSTPSRNIVNEAGVTPRPRTKTCAGRSATSSLEDKAQR